MFSFNRHEELDRYAREKEVAVLKIKDSRNEAERHFQVKIRQLCAKLEASEVEQRREDWSQQDTIKEKDQMIEKWVVSLLAH